MYEPEQKTPGVDSARRALRVLLLFGDTHHPLNAEDIAAEIGISLPSAYRFLSLLRELSLIDKAGENTYSLTPRSLILAEGAQRALDISPVVRPIVKQLAFSLGEAALSIQRIGDYATCAELSEVNHTVKISFQPGQVLTLHRGAGSKVLLASMSRTWLQGYCDRVFTAPARSKFEELEEELLQIERRGWATSSAEIDQGVWAAAAPIKMRGQTIAALSVAGPEYRISEKTQQEILDQVVEKAAQASQELDLQIVHPTLP